MRILNISNRGIVPELTAMGVFNPIEISVVKTLLRFKVSPTDEECVKRAKILANLANGYDVDAILISAAPFFISYLEKAILDEGLIPVHPFHTVDKHGSKRINGLVNLSEAG